MHIEAFRDYCLGKAGVEETFPFDEVTLVFKVMGKMFALTGLDKEEFTVNLKADPEQSIIWRDEYHQIRPGWHMSKKHWNTVHVEDGLEESFFVELIDHSYDMVVKGLTKKLKAELEELKSKG